MSLEASGQFATESDSLRAGSLSEGDYYGRARAALFGPGRAAAAFPGPGCAGADHWHAREDIMILKATSGNANNKGRFKLVSILLVSRSSHECQ